MVHCHAASHLRGFADGTRCAFGVKSIDGFPHLGHGSGLMSPSDMSRTCPASAIGHHAPRQRTFVAQRTLHVYVARTSLVTVQWRGVFALNA